jgi:multiple sugar transport system permease protein
VTSDEADRRAGLALTAPAVIALLAVAGAPIAAAAWLSLRRRELVFGEDRFVGLANYAFLARDARFWAALRHTLVFAAAAVTIELALGLAIALALDGARRGRGLARVAVLVPWALPTVVSVQLWAWLFHPETGLVARLAPGHGNFLGEPGPALAAAVVVDVWKTTPFVALLLLAGLATIPPDLARAAAVDGASPSQTLRLVTLPLLAPTIGVVLVFRTLDALRVFDAVFVLTGGGPANSTETLSIYADKTLMRLGDFGYGSALAVVTFAIVLVVGLVELAAARRAERP